MERKYLWEFYMDFGRMGELDGLFVAYPSEIDDAIGKEVYFGEVLGKHSEVYGWLGAEHLNKLEVSETSIYDVGRHLGNTWSGWNPLHYVKTYCEGCEESFRFDEATVVYRERFDKIMCEECFEEESIKDEQKDEEQE